MTTDPFAGPSHDPNPDRPRPEVVAAYPGECFCGLEYDEGDLIRATADGAGWEAVDHGHDPEESAPASTAPVEVGRLPLPAPPAGLYAVDVPTDAELRAALDSGHPEVEAGASLLLSMTMTERGVYLAQQQSAGEGEAVAAELEVMGNGGPSRQPGETDAEYAEAVAEWEATRTPVQFSCPECPKTFAPTKDQRVRTHKRLSDGERCPGSRAVPLELLEDARTPAVPDAPSAPPEPVLVPEPGSALANAVASSSQVAAMVDRINEGRTGMIYPNDGRTPEQQALMDARRASGGRMEVAGFASGSPLHLPEELLEDASEAMYNKVNGLTELAPEGVTAAPSSTPALANPDVDRAALYTYRPAEPEPTPENGGREPVYGRYVLPNPKTGKGKTWRRATTFAGQLDDTYNLDAWQKRHLVRGAAMAAAQDPQRLARVATWDVKQQKNALNELAEALMAESGMNTAAEQGTLVHTLTEGVDRAAGEMQDMDAWYAVPEHYRPDVEAYRKALVTYGLRVVPSLLERRTAVVEYGVAGTFDQVTEVVELQDWSRRAGLGLGDFLVTDKKTGSDMSYGTGTHGIQLWLYAHGINTSGVWDAFTGRWTHPVRVREDVGVIVHIPLEQGKCTLHALNLERGKEGAVLVQQGYDRAKLIRSQALRFSVPIGTVTVPRPDPSPTPQEPPVQQPVAPAQPDPMQVWRDRLATVTDQQQAYAAYQDARDAGMPADLLAGYQVALTAKLGLSEPSAPTPPSPAPATDPMAPWLERAGRVETLDGAKALYAEAVAAGMPDGPQKQLTDALDLRLKQLASGAPAGPDPMSAEYWAPVAMQCQDEDDAQNLYGAMAAQGVPADVQAVVSQRVRDWLASQRQAAALMAPPVVPAAVPHADDSQWDSWARGVVTPAHASDMFRQAQQAPGMTEQRLFALTSAMQQALANQPPF